jgi:hypothetical protein
MTRAFLEFSEESQCYSYKGQFHKCGNSEKWKQHSSRWHSSLGSYFILRERKQAVHRAEETHISTSHSPSFSPCKYSVFILGCLWQTTGIGEHNFRSNIVMKWLLFCNKVHQVIVLKDGFPWFPLVFYSLHYAHTVISSHVFRVMCSVYWCMFICYSNKMEISDLLIDFTASTTLSKILPRILW